MGFTEAQPPVEEQSLERVTMMTFLDLANEYVRGT